MTGMVSMRGEEVSFRVLVICLLVLTTCRNESQWYEHSEKWINDYFYSIFNWGLIWVRIAGFGVREESIKQPISIFGEPIVHK